MSERIPSVIQGTREINDAVSLFVGGKIFEGWEDVRITRELNSCASDFSLQLVDKWAIEQAPWVIVAGEAVHIHLGKQSVLTGYIDKLETSVSATERRLTVSGRSKTGDLVDCSVEGNASYSGLTIKAIAEKICKPFGINVVMLGDSGAAFESVTLQQGETAFALLDRLARERKLLMYPSYEGSLILASKGNARASNEIHQGVNLLSGKTTHDNTNRFSKYSIKGDNLVGVFGASIAAGLPTGTATDSGITRYRPLVLLAENPTDNKTGEDRATYEAHLRAAKSLTAEIEVQGWTQSDGKLWEINQLVYVNAGFLGIKRRMLIQKVDFNKSNAGTTCSMSLIREDAYSFQKKIKKEENMGWTKFIAKPDATAKGTQ